MFLENYAYLFIFMKRFAMLYISIDMKNKCFIVNLGFFAKKEIFQLTRFRIEKNKLNLILSFFLIQIQN